MQRSRMSWLVTPGCRARKHCGCLGRITLASPLRRLLKDVCCRTASGEQILRANHSSSLSRHGRMNTAQPFCPSYARWALPAIGPGHDSPWILSAPLRYEKPSTNSSMKILFSEASDWSTGILLHRRHWLMTKSRWKTSLATCTTSATRCLMDQAISPLQQQDRKPCLVIPALPSILMTLVPQVCEASPYVSQLLVARFPSSKMTTW